MKREQIKELKGMISQAVADDRMSQSCAVEVVRIQRGGARFP